MLHSKGPFENNQPYNNNPLVLLKSNNPYITEMTILSFDLFSLPFETSQRAQTSPGRLILISFQMYRKSNKDSALAESWRFFQKTAATRPPCLLNSYL